MNISELNPYMNQLVRLKAKNGIGQGMILYGYIRELHIFNGSEYLIWQDSDEDCKQKFVIRNVIDVEKIV
jgi:hypothetical protein